MAGLEHKTLISFVVQALREKIISGALPAGSRIDQNAVAEELGVSRMPVREALRQLDAEGFVELISHRGALVAKLSEDEIIEIYEMRSVLAGLASRLAVPEFTDETIEELERLASAMETADPDQWIELNDTFHMKIEEPCGAKRLLALIERLTQQCRPYLRISVHMVHTQQSAKAEHERILDACRKRQPIELEAAVRDHLASAGQVVASFVGHARAAEIGEPRPNATVDGGASTGAGRTAG
jgi:DNA-binding GntR family transcriptional regulator